MRVDWPNRPEYARTFKRLKGKSCKVRFFRSYVYEILFFLAFASSGFCDELSMVSVSPGFEISALDRSTTWVSKNGVFAFGFLDGSLNGVNDGQGFVVGIRYNLGSEASNVPVWSVGGGIRVSHNSTFKFSHDGRLVLFDNPNGLVVWSTNTSAMGVQKATLLDDGNLVLIGLEDELIWQSFNSPTSTLLPGQTFHFPQTLRAPSTRSILSYYSLMIRRSGELALVWEANVTYWRSQLSSSVEVKEARFDSSGIFGLYDVTNATVWSVSSEDFKDSSVSLRRVRIEPDGNLRMYSWDGALCVWKISWQAVENQCDVFGSCGLYSLCGFNSTESVCSCLYESSFSQNSGVPETDSGAAVGCRKMVDLSNCKMPSLMSLKHTLLYGLYPPHDMKIMLNEDDCKSYCVNDTSCVAVTSKNDGSGFCTIKRTSFISGYTNPSVASVSYMKVCLVPQAVSAQRAHPASSSDMASSAKGLIFHADSIEFIRALSLVGLVTVVGSIAVQAFAFVFVYGRRKVSDVRRIPFSEDANNEMEKNYSVLIRLTFEEIKELTCNFTNQLGPSIFKGRLPNGSPIIAKVLYGVNVSEKNFRVAVSILCGTHHRNVAALKGFCYDEKHKILLYEYIPNGSLDKWLSDEEENQKEGHLRKRLDIAVGIAKGLMYLHTECQNCIFHGNLKLENVMLDELSVPKLMDFGLQRLVVTQEEEEKERASSSSAESPSDRDIYRLGEMLIQIVTCERRVYSGEEIGRLVEALIERLNIVRDEEEERVERVVKIAMWCMQNQPFLRPSIGEVVKIKFRRGWSIWRHVLRVTRGLKLKEKPEQEED
ncbi:hypothetical protein V2J09_022745 [Rumex salicifolius]